MSQYIKYIITPVIIFFVFFFICISVYQQVTIDYWDEHEWIGRSYYFDLFIRGDVDSSLWQTYHAIDQPKLAEYVYGAALYPSYLQYRRIYPDKDYIQFLIDHNFYSVESGKYAQYKKMNSSYIDWGRNPGEVFEITPERLQEKFGDGIKKTVDLIYTARKANIFLLSATLVFFYFIAKILTNYPTALLAVFLLATNNLFIKAGIRAFSEGTFIFLFTLSILLMLRHVATNKIVGKTNLIYIVVLAAITALLTLTKLNGIMMLIFLISYYSCFLLYSLFKKKYYIASHVFLNITLSIGIFLIVFISLYPTLYSNPLEKIHSLYTHRWNVAMDQTELPDQQKYYLPTYTSRITSIYSYLFLSRENYCRSNFIVSFYFICMRSQLPFNFISLGAFILGGIYLVRQAMSRKKEYVFIVILFVFIQLVMGKYLLLKWDRYYIQLLIFINLF
ncbi:MAG: hypothetical protein NUV98_01010, partial [Candidatus Roizmanbacteria bacterium]|nr:hypothetical protein [Candidatus Roizmanbacteria bacterium]